MIKPVLLLIGLSLCIAGCGPVEPPASIIVTGKVEYLGRPLSGGMVVFSADPAGGEDQAMGYAIIQPDGAFQLKPMHSERMTTGWFRIAVAPPPNSIGFPNRYRQPEHSGLVRELVADRENVIHLQLDAP